MIAQFSGPEYDDFVNPVIPAWYDLWWSAGGVLILLALVTVWVVALISIRRHSDRLSPTATAVWVAIVLFASLLGAIAWFTIGRPQARERPSTK